MRPDVSFVLLAAVLSVPLSAQTLSEQLQKGIYAEETLGNRAEAASIYRQIIAAPRGLRRRENRTALMSYRRWPQRPRSSSRTNAGPSSTAATVMPHPA
jgi:hypothetical protein